MLILTDYDKKVYQNELKPFLPNEFIDVMQKFYQKFVKELHYD
mgnify:CR=1 FL=1